MKSLPYKTVAFLIIAMVGLFLTNAMAKNNHAIIIPIKKDMNYSAARQKLILSGWIVPALPKGGYKEGDEKVISNCSSNVAMCNKYPEIDSCSGSGEGYCNMLFHSKTGKQLTVLTIGGLSSDTTVDSWSLN